MIKFAAIALFTATIFSVSATKTNNIIQTTPTFPEPTTEFMTVAVDSADTMPIHIEDLQEADIDSTDETIANLTEFASTLLGRKYVWGAVGPKTFDCSGFTSYVFRNQGIELPRTSRMQYTQGQRVDRNDLRPGDLMFFSSPRTSKGVVGHVGMVVSVDDSTGSVTFIHASTKKGITYQKFPDGGYYSRCFIGAKRIVGNSEA